MPPNNFQNQSGAPVSLPPVPPGTQPQQPNPTHQQGPSDVPLGKASVHYVEQTRRLVEQYANDPYRLSAALAQLKSAYLAEQFHIVSNQAGN